jgi:diguanylate cyclase (GGDEF)-like protein
VTELLRPQKLSQIKKRFVESDSSQSLTGHLFGLTSQLMGAGGEGSALGLKSVAAQIADIAAVDSVLVLLKSPEGEPGIGLKNISSFGLSPQDEKVLTFYIEHEVFERLSAQKTPMQISDYRHQLLEGNSYGQRNKLVSLLAVPMLFKGQVLGVLALARGEVSGFYQDDEEILQRIGNFVAEDLERSWQYANVVKDPITGFYHRQVMVDFLAQEVARSRRYQAPMSIMMIDIDGFAPLRSQISEPDADQVLRKVAQRIAGEVRQSDVCARASDNAFMLMHPMTPSRNATELAVRLRAKFNKYPVSVNETPLQIGLSIGISSLNNDDDEPLALVFRADRALSAAKRMGGNQIVVDDA